MSYNSINAQKLQSKEQILAEMSNVGTVHNQSLDNFYNQIKLQKDEIASRKGDDPKAIILDIVGQTILVNIPSNPMEPYLRTSESTVKSILESEFEKTKTNLSKSKAEIVKELNLTEDEKKYVTDLLSIVSLYSQNPPKLESEIATFNDKVYANFSKTPNTIKVLFAASSIAKSSALYWNENSNKWKEIAFNSTNISGKNEACCKTVVTADIGGAVGGAVTGLMAGGIGAIPGAAAGAVGGSLAQGVIEFLNWLW